MKKTVQRALSFITFLLMLSSMAYSTYAEENIDLVRTIAFIDEGLEDYDILSGIVSKKMPVYTIHSDKDGILQITNVLRNYDGLDGIEIYSKGEIGGVQMGTSFLNVETIDKYEEYMKSWSDNINLKADILLYACNVAKEDEGKKLINQISEITGADVAASINYTGTYGENTDWNLEYSVGNIETYKEFNVKDMQEYKYRLDGTTRTWDGEGSDNNWSTAKNWSGDKMPDATDIVVFDNTSTKSVDVDGKRSVYDLIINPGYTKKIDEYNTGMITGDTITVNNNFQMNGGNVELNTLKVNGTTSVTTGGGIECSYFYTYGDVNITGLENPIDSEMHIGKKDDKKATIIDGDFKVANIYFDESDHDYQIKGNITIDKNEDAYQTLGFENNGNITINDGAKIDISKCQSYYHSYYHWYYYSYSNSGTITEAGSGSLYFDAKDFYFSNNNGEPVITYSVGEKVFISLTDLDSNLDKDNKETVTVIIKRESDLNDTVTMTLTETDTNSSIFRNLEGLELVDIDTTPLDGQLKYDGTENLIAEFTDINSPEDTISCKMDRDPIVWTGEGVEYSDGEEKYNYWRYAENWSTTTVPKMYDIILFNDTSVKNVSLNNRLEISKIVIDDGYTGKIKTYDSSSYDSTVYNDIIVKDGTISFNSKMTVNGDVDIQGGILNNKPSSDNSIISGDLNINGGEFNLLYDCLEIKGDLNISKGSLATNDPSGWYSNQQIDFYGNANISGGTIDINKAYIKSDESKISVDNIDGEIIDELVIEENTEINGIMGVGSLMLNINKTLDIDGTLTCQDSLINNGTVNVADGSILDFKSVMTYKNNMIIDNDTGKILYDAGGIGFVDSNGVPIGTANIGDQIFVELIDLSNNKNVNEIETVEVTVYSQVTGDTEVISLTETDNDTGVFRSQTGVELIDLGIDPSEGQLKYDGIEELKVVYIDARDENDTVSCNLHRDPVIWDGEGSDNNWTTLENWSEDTVPTRYDIITLNDTSIKDIYFNTNIEMYKLLVEELYTGEIKGEENASFYSASDVVIEGGIIKILGRFQTGGNLTVNGGSIELLYNNGLEHNIIGGDLSVIDGEIILTKGHFDIKGNMSAIGGTVKTSENWWESANVYTYGDVNLLVKTNIANMEMFGNEFICSIDTENVFSTLSIKTIENFNLKGSMVVKTFYNSGTTDISGEGTIITLDKEGSFNNYKALNIMDGAIFNASNFNYSNNYSSFHNNGQINESNGGRFYCDTKDMFFTNTSGERIVFADINDEVSVKLIDGNLNKDGSIKEEVTITVESVENGDTEDITLIETTNNSGIFTNTSYILLVEDNLEPVSGQLRYNGTEDLQTIYTDSSDSEDVFTCNLFRDPLVWDGGGDDDYWYTPENWSEDRKPDEYDRIVFNETSNKNSEQYWIIPKVYSITIDESYLGVVKTNRDLNVTENIVVNGGKLEISQYKIKVEGSLQLNGGVVDDNSSGEDEIQNLIITDGELKPYYFSVKNSFIMTGGKVNGDDWGLVKLEGDIDIKNAEEFKVAELNLYGKNVDISGNSIHVQNLKVSTDGEVNLNGNIDISGYYWSSVFEISDKSILNLNGKIECLEEDSNGLNNSGTLNINDDSVLDLRKTNSFTNTGTISISDTAKLLYDTEAMGVTDGSGAPELDKFKFGDSLIVSLIDRNRNLDNSKAENVHVTLINWTNGDEETYNLIETGEDTCQFRGAGFTTNSIDASTKGNSTFEGKDGDAFQITYTDKMSGRVEYVVSKNCAELDIDGIDDLIIDGIDYGNGDIDGNPSSFTITLQNRGDKPLGILDITLDNTDDFTFEEEPETSDMEPDSTRDINIDFIPTSCGEKTANLTIKTNDNDEGEIKIPIKGIGVEPPVSSGIEDITLLQGKESFEINVFDIFSDAQDSDGDLEYSIVENNNDSLLVNSKIDKVTGILTLYFNTDQSGTSYITLRTTDSSNAYVDEEFSVTVSQGYTISGKVVDADGKSIEGAVVSIMDYWDEEKCYTDTTSSNGTFSISFPSSVIGSWRNIKVNKLPYLENMTMSTSWGDEDLGNITLGIGTDVQPIAPILQSAVAGDGQVTLTWTAETGAIENMLYKSTISGFYEEPVAIVDSSTTSYDITGLDNDKTYYFVVRSTNMCCESEYSNEISAMPETESEVTITVPGEPTKVSATAGNGQANISFRSPEDNGGSEITQYIVISSPGNITTTGTGISITVTGLTNGTEYTFTVNAENEVGISQSSTASNSITPYENVSGGNSNHAKHDSEGVEILFNGKPVTAATSKTVEIENEKITTVYVDDKKVEEKLQSEDNSAVITIPFKNNSDVVVGRLNGQTIKDMEVREAVLKIETDNVIYSLPASQINIDNVLSEIGNKVELKDIVVEVKVSKPSESIVSIIEDTANKNNYQIVVRPIEFEISWTHGDKTVKVSKFNDYVERIVAIPEDVDASKITTGIVLNQDGTYSHVPTVITVIDGKYYAKINSLTNSTYSVIYSPKTFKDTEDHWAEDSIKDMGSRLIVNGSGNGYYEPDKDITRAEFGTIVVKSLGLMRNGEGEDVFDDVTRNDWYYDAVSIAYEFGLISGYGNGEFEPMEKITREESMTIIAKAMGIVNLKAEFKNGEKDKLLSSFNDFDVASDWARDSIVSCVKSEVVLGREGKLIEPKENITRAEVAVIVRRLLKVSGLI